MTYQFEWDINVGQTDFSGRIYTPELTAAMARGLETMMSDIGYGPRRAFDEGVVYPVAHIEADYLHPISLSDTITVSFDPSVGNTSITVTAAGVNRQGDSVFEGKLTAVFVKNDTNEPMQVPNHVRDKLAAF